MSHITEVCAALRETLQCRDGADSLLLCAVAATNVSLGMLSMRACREASFDGRSDPEHACWSCWCVQVLVLLVRAGPAAWCVQMGQQYG